MGFGEGAQAPPYGEGMDLIYTGEVLVQEVVVWIVPLSYICSESEREKNNEAAVSGGPARICRGVNELLVIFFLINTLIL